VNEQKLVRGFGMEAQPSDTMASKFLRFIVVGVVCSLLFFSVYFLLLNIIKLNLITTTAVTYSICLGIGYFLQRKFTFRATGAYRRSLLRYLALHSSGMVFVYFSTRWIEATYGFGALGASMTATAIAGFVSFVISLTWVFAEPNHGALEG
jgi:putative flippase GtrA